MTFTKVSKVSLFISAIFLATALPTTKAVRWSNEL